MGEGFGVVGGEREGGIGGGRVVGVAGLGWEEVSKRDRRSSSAMETGGLARVVGEGEPRT